MVNINFKSKIKKIMFTIAVVVIFGVILFPPLFLFLTSLKTEVDALSFPPKWIFKPTIKNYIDIFGDFTLIKNLLNSIIVAISNTVISLLFGSMAAYSLARFKFKGSDNIAFWMLSIRMMPPVVAIIPIYIIMRNLHLLDTNWALIIAYLTINLPFVIWMMKGFFEDIPKEIEESAMVDGCSVFDVFRKIAIPLVAPGLAATGIFTFIFSWNEFLMALILTGTKSATLPVGLIGCMRETGINWGYMTSGGVIALIPVLIFALFAQKNIVKGLTMGAIK